MLFDKHGFETVIDRRQFGSLKWVVCQHGEIPLWLADMDFRCPQEILDSLNQVISFGILGYTEVSQSYYTSLIKWLEDNQGFSLSQSCILPVSGVMPALIAAVEALTN